jgi:hypothetical protein
MVRLAKRYDLYLPLNFNDGKPIPDQLFASVEKTLLARFAGITSQQREFPLKGIWQGKKHLYFDQVMSSRRWIFGREAAEFCGPN